MRELDEFDKKILNLLQRNNRLTSEEIGIQVGLSQSATQRRITKLRNTNVIEADVSIVNADFVGHGITCIVDVILYEGNAKAIDEFKNAMNACNEVMQCYYVTGSYDFVLIVQAESMGHFEEFQKVHLMNNSNLKHFYTHVVMDKVKMNYKIDL